MPQIHCITNYITANDCANALIAIGASPVMAHHPMEVEEITSNSDALLCNMGAMESIDAMFIAGKEAHKKGHPIVLDPVGVAGSSYRRKVCCELIATIHPDCIKGNISEIKALLLDKSIAGGVDAKSDETLKKDEIISLANRYKTTIVVSGQKDIVCDGKNIYEITGGSRMFKKITGSGCMEGAVIAAFLSKENSVDSVINAIKYFNRAGEIAEKITKDNSDGSMTFRNELINVLSRMPEWP